MRKLYPKVKPVRSKEEVVKFLENLVWSRFTEKELNKKLSTFFQERIEVYNTSQEREDNNDSDELADWNLMFNIFREDEYELFGDIYVLPTREVVDETDVKLYVTEIGYEFC